VSVRGWLTRLRATAGGTRPIWAADPEAAVRALSGKYVLLYEYLEHRHANSVVLTFAEVEDLLGFALPDQARRRREWWTDAVAPMAAASHCDAWLLAHRTAVPNLAAQTVVFDRAS